MINIDEKKKVATLSNNALSTTLDYNDGITFKDFSNKFGSKKSNVDKDLFRIKIYGDEYCSKDFDLVDVSSAEDKKQELLTFLLENQSLCMKVKVHFIVEHEDTISILYQVCDDFKYGDPHVSYLRIPLLADLEVNGAEDIYYCPGNAVKASDGRQVIKPVREYQYSTDMKLPLVVCDSDNKVGFSVLFPFLSDLNDAGSTQNENKVFSAMETREDFQNHYLHMNPDESFNDTIELRISAIKNGWVEAFEDYRDYWASSYDFSEYEKEDLKWFNDCVVHNFVFLYGKEGFDHEKQVIDVEGLCKQGDEFGGYDTVTIWNQYPRLGIDARTQWDFYDDFPGGREAIKDAVTKFHEKGVYLFLPYIPWDRGPGESTDSMGDEFAKIVKDTDADGYQLDTMHDIPLTFRWKLNDIRPGLVLTSQFHPAKKIPVEVLTTSWNEFWGVNPMPEVDIMRFICPIHLSPVISRWLRHEDKDVLIKRVEFGAAPIVIWQDIFGRWLPFSKDQKEEIKSWKKAYLENKEIYQGLKPVPCYPTNTPNLYCNLFKDEKAEEQIYSFYNDSDEMLKVDSLELYGEGFKNASVVFGESKAKLDGNKLSAKVAPRKVLHVLVS